MSKRLLAFNLAVMAFFLGAALLAADKVSGWLGRDLSLRVPGIVLVAASVPVMVGLFAYSLMDTSRRAVDALRYYS